MASSVFSCLERLVARSTSLAAIASSKSSINCLTVRRCASLASCSFCWSVAFTPSLCIFSCVAKIAAAICIWSKSNTSSPLPRIKAALSNFSCLSFSLVVFFCVAKICFSVFNVIFLRRSVALLALSFLLRSWTANLAVVASIVGTNSPVTINPTPLTNASKTFNKPCTALLSPTRLKALIASLAKVLTPAVSFPSVSPKLIMSFCKSSMLCPDASIPLTKPLPNASEAKSPASFNLAILPAKVSAALAADPEKRSRKSPSTLSKSLPASSAVVKPIRKRAREVTSPLKARCSPIDTVCRFLPVAALISKATPNKSCACVVSLVACDSDIKALVRSLPVTPLSKAKSSMYSFISGDAKPKFIASKADANCAASLSAS